MSYRNSSTYVQRQINIILRKYRHFVKAYVDDIIVFFNSLKKYFRYLMQIFALFKKYNIVIKTSKIYLSYLFIVLLLRCAKRYAILDIQKIKSFSRLIKM